MCKQFHEKNFCPYGKRCLFIHEVRAFEEVHSYYYLNLLRDFEMREKQIGYTIDQEETRNSGINQAPESSDAQSSPILDFLANSSKQKSRLPIFASLNSEDAHINLKKSHQRTDSLSEKSDGFETQTSSNGSDLSRRESFCKRHTFYSPLNSEGQQPLFIEEPFDLHFFPNQPMYFEVGSF
jgi:Zinc finger C-x8-C-x5-C-x3-H type (and similar)